MAIVNGNPWVSGASGMVMNQIVYRQRAGRTIVSAKQRKPEKPASDKQQKHRERFRLATRYAKVAAKDSVKGPLYAQRADGFNSAYNIALKDYMAAPVINGFDLKDFRGRKGNRIGIYAEDNLRVAELRVSLLNAAGEVLASGQAEEVIDNTYFSYKLSADLPAGEWLTLRAEAKDYAGNVTVRETAIEGIEQGRAMPGIQKLIGSFLLVAAMLLTACGGADDGNGKTVFDTDPVLSSHEVDDSTKKAIRIITQKIPLLPGRGQVNKTDVFVNQGGKLLSDFTATLLDKADCFKSETWHRPGIFKFVT